MTTNKAAEAAKSALKTTRYLMYFSMALNLALAGALMYVYFGSVCSEFSSNIPSIKSGVVAGKDASASLAEKEDIPSTESISARIKNGSE